MKSEKTAKTREIESKNTDAKVAIKASPIIDLSSARDAENLKSSDIKDSSHSSPSSPKTPQK